MLHALIWIQASPPHQCPLLRRVDCLPQVPRALIREQSTLRRIPDPRQGDTGPPNDMPPTQRALNQWTGNEADAWLELQQWMQFVPQRLRDRLRWSQGHSHLPPRGATHLLLYAGKDDSTSLDSCIRKIFPYYRPSSLHWTFGEKARKSSMTSSGTNHTVTSAIGHWRASLRALGEAPTAALEAFIGSPSQVHRRQYEAAKNPTAGAWKV